MVMMSGGMVVSGGIMMVLGGRMLALFGHSGSPGWCLSGADSMLGVNMLRPIFSARLVPRSLGLLRCGKAASDEGRRSDGGAQGCW
jgi:hypothetical protein